MTRWASLGSFYYEGQPNTPPVLDPIGNKSTDEGVELTFVATASDARTPTEDLTFSLTGAVPAGASIGLNTGEFTWTPTEAQGSDSYTFSVQVSDGTLTDSEQITITVEPANAPPEVSSASFPMTPAGGDQTFSLGSLVSDAETALADLVFELNTAGLTGTLSGPDASGGFTYNPGDFIGETSFQYRVTDTGQVGGDELASDWATITLQVGNKRYFDEKGKLVYVDSDGDNVTVTAKGAEGYVLLPGDTGDAIGIILQNTSAATSVSFSVKADKVAGGTGQTTIGQLTADGLLKGISGKGVSLAGDMALNTGGAIPMAKDCVSISLDGVTDGSIDTNGLGIKSLSVMNWADTDVTPDTLNALYVSSISVKGAKADPNLPGNFQADITTTGTDAKGLSLGKLAVVGDFSGDHVLAGAAGSITVGRWATGSMDVTFAKSISIRGKKAAKDGTGGLAGDFGVDLSFTGADANGVSLGKFAAAGTATGEIRTAGSIGSVAIASVDGFDLLAGIDPAAGRFPTLAADFVNPAASIKSVKIAGIKGQAGTFFQDCNIAAATIGSVGLCNADFDAGHSSITALDQGTGKEIKKVSYANKALGENWSWPIKNGVFAGPADLIHIL